MVTLEFYNPSGTTEVTRPHAPRLDTLSGKKIGFISNDSWQAYRSLPMIKSMLEEDFSDIKVLPVDTFPKGSERIGEDATIELVKRSGVDAVVIGNAACGACSTACGVAAARIEAEGIPTVMLTREDFVGVVRNAVSGMGFAPDSSMVTFPIEMFLPDADLSPLRARKGDFYAGLTNWTPVDSVDSESQMLSVQGATYEEALMKANHLMMTNLWGDGMPLWPATRERVEWIMRGTDLPRNHLLGKMPARGGLCTVESCAIALAMAGGRPEYLPVLIAAMEAMIDPAANSAQLQATSGASFPVVIVNGPIAREIRLNSGFGCLGPDPQHPAGASIGRAMRQLQQNLGGALPGVGTMAPWGNNRYNNIIFAEDEDGLPEGWEPHGTERHGYSRGTNSISFFWATGASNILRRSATTETMEQDVDQGLNRMAQYMAVPHVHYRQGYADGTPGAMLVTRVVADYFAGQGFKTKQQLREALWERSRIPQQRMLEAGVHSWLDRSAFQVVRDNARVDPWPITSKPENIVLIVAGGAHPTHSFWMQGFARAVVGRPVTTPQRFESLLRDADRDLGCADETCAI